MKKKELLFPNMPPFPDKYYGEKMIILSKEDTIEWLPLTDLQLWMQQKAMYFGWFQSQKLLFFSIPVIKIGKR